MTAAHGREFLSIPGPTNIPDVVLAAMQRPAIDIYSGDMLDLTRSLHEDMPKSSGPRADYIYAANGHGGWEAAVSNVLSRGETVLVLESGLFAAGWGDMAADDGRQGRGAEGRRRRAVIRPRSPSAWRPTPSREIKADPGRADRHRLERRQRPARHPPRHRRGRASRAPDGRRRGLAGLHAVRDGRLGDRRGHGRLAEGPDDAARPGLRRRQRAGARRPPEGRPAHALLGLDVSAGRGALPEVRRHAAGAPALRAPQGARPAARRGARARGAPPRAARRGHPPGRRPLGGGRAPSPSTSPQPAERANSVTSS